jgi:hypothetical protein
MKATSTDHLGSDGAPGYRDGSPTARSIPSATGCTSRLTRGCAPEFFQNDARPVCRARILRAALAQCGDLGEAGGSLKDIYLDASARVKRDWQELGSEVLTRPLNKPCLAIQGSG